MRLASRAGRLVLDVEGTAVDVAERSGGRFSADPMGAFEAWDALQRWADEQRRDDRDPVLDPATLGPPVPRPTQVFAIGLNYRDHAEEAGLPIPEEPMVFTKFPSCLAGPNADVPLSSDRVDWEVEQVVVIGREAHRIAPESAWDHVAGCCVGQDVSDRRLQFSGNPPQFSLGKSAPGFGPIGPVLVSTDELPDRDALALRCWIDDELVQDSTTANLIFPVPELLAYLSRVCVLRSGDLVFTGTPAGVGSVRQPRRYLAAGETITSEIEGIGRLVNRCVADG